MSAVNELHVKIDDQIKQDPSLLSAVEEATAYFDGFLHDHPNVVGHTRGLVWRLDHDPVEGTRLAVSYNDQDRYGFRHVTKWVRPAEMADPVNRDIAVLHLARQLGDQARAQLDKVIGQHLLELEREENDGHPH